MADTRSAPMQIGQMNLRIPGTSADVGHRIPEGVGNRLADKLPPGLERRLGAVSVRVQIRSGATEAEMCEAIADSIVKALSRANPSTPSERR
jgi:hypothetical protein